MFIVRRKPVFPESLGSFPFAFDCRKVFFVLFSLLTSSTTPCLFFLSVPTVSWSYCINVVLQPLKKYPNKTLVLKQLESTSITT